MQHTTRLKKVQSLHRQVAIARLEKREQQRVLSLDDPTIQSSRCRVGPEEDQRVDRSQFSCWKLYWHMVIHFQYTSAAPSAIQCERRRGGRSRSSNAIVLSGGCARRKSSRSGRDPPPKKREQESSGKKGVLGKWSSTPGGAASSVLRYVARDNKIQAGTALCSA